VKIDTESPIESSDSVDERRFDSAGDGSRSAAIAIKADLKALAGDFHLIAMFGATGADRVEGLLDVLLDQRNHQVGRRQRCKVSRLQNFKMTIGYRVSEFLELRRRPYP